MLGLSMGDAAGDYGLTGIDLEDNKNDDDDDEVKKRENVKVDIYKSKKKVKPRKEEKKTYTEARKKLNQENSVTFHLI
jgi:hypothetical protein